MKNGKLPAEIETELNKLKVFQSTVRKHFNQINKNMDPQERMTQKNILRGNLQTNFNALEMLQQRIKYLAESEAAKYFNLDLLLVKTEVDLAMALETIKNGMEKLNGS